MTFRLYGLREQPSGWAVLAPGEVLNAQPFYKEPGLFVKEFDSYQACRAWVLDELTLRRRELGLCMQRWYKVPDAFHESKKAQA